MLVHCRLQLARTPELLPGHDCAPRDGLARRSGQRGRDPSVMRVQLVKRSTEWQQVWSCKELRERAGQRRELDAHGAQRCSKLTGPASGRNDGRVEQATTSTQRRTPTPRASRKLLPACSAMAHPGGAPPENEHDGASWRPAGDVCAPGTGDGSACEHCRRLLSRCGGWAALALLCLRLTCRGRLSRGARACDPASPIPAVR